MAASPMFTGELPVSMDLGPFELINELHMARDRYRDAWHKTWVDYKLDAVIAPAAQNTAVPHDTFGWPPYTVFLNLLDYPACIIPYSKASKHLDPEPQPPDDGEQPGYDPAAVHDAPGAIQVFAPRSQDERCLAMARVIDRDTRC